MAAELEAELQAQLAEQQEALEGVRQLLAADPDCAETADLLAELQTGIAETESALLGLKRQRLLAELDAMHGGEEGEQQQQQGQQQGWPAEQQGGQQQADDGGTKAGSSLEPGSTCLFRHTDGRWYHGIVESGSNGTMQLRFARPTRTFQLELLSLPEAACLPAPPGSLQPDASLLHPGARVVVQPPGRKLWEAAEVAEVDAAGLRVAAITLADRQRWVLPLSAVALSGHAPDPHGSDSEGERGSAVDAADSEEEEGGSSGGGSGSDTEFGSEEDDREGDGEGGGGGAFGSAGFGRVSLAMAEAADLLQQQAAAGPQSGTTLFFSSEAHSRGIGSKLLAKMGFRAGRGLGRQQQGLQQALQAAPMRRGAGLGVESGGGAKEGGKKRRSGKQRRRHKAAEAREAAKDAAASKQAELEKETGSVGLFAVLNSIVGDASQAQTVRQANLGMAGSASGGTARQAHLFGGSSGGAQHRAPKEEDRRALAKRADDLSQLRLKVQRLSEMATRNTKDKVMLPQIKRALAEAQAALAAAEREHTASTSAIHAREKQKRWAKF
ncbi:hypothetical protein ABPG75_013311 [Micractinium tetrahymenae]